MQLYSYVNLLESTTCTCIQTQYLHGRSAYDYVNKHTSHKQKDGTGKQAQGVITNDHIIVSTLVLQYTSWRNSLFISSFVNDDCHSLKLVDLYVAVQEPVARVV